MLIVNSGGLRSSSDGYLEIARVLYEHSGSYSCVARNNFTSSSAMFQITPGGLSCDIVPVYVVSFPFIKIINIDIRIKNLVRVTDRRRQ